jgi:hypothetical protein
MTETGLQKLEQRPILHMMKRMILLTAVALAGCVNVSAPDKPIVINLNINVSQEVVYRLDGEAKSLIQQNPGIF